MSGTAILTFSRTTKGELPGEAVFSEARGYPRAGAFYQSRLHMGGVPGVPDGWLASVIGDYFNFDTTIDDATRGLFIRADTDQTSAIYQIISGRHLTFFTSDGEFYVPSDRIDNDVVLRWTTDAGSKEGLSVHRVDGALLFVQGVKDKRDDTREIATSVREFIFDEAVAAYRNPLLSKLSARLIDNPVDVALRRALSTDESDLMLYVNEGGGAVAYTVLREELVNAFMPVDIREGDDILAVGVDKLRRVFWITERQINGSPRRYVEVWNEDLYLDCGGIITMDFTNVTAAGDAQSDYVWTFDNPASAAQIGVRINGGRLEADQYTVNMGTKTVTLDAAVAADIAAGDIVRISSMVQTVTGLDHLEGETIATYVDGTPAASYTVSGGQITLGDYADTEIQYGFEFDVEGELMPLRIPESQTLSAEVVRVISLIFNLFETVGLEYQANGSDWTDLPLNVTDAPVLDRSAEELLFTGEIKVEGLAGYEVGAPVKFRRPKSGPFTVLGVTREVVL